MECPKEFDDIRPFYDSEFHDKMKVLVTEPGFEHAVRYVLRDINYELFCQELLTIDNKKDFQLLVMRSFLEGLTQKTTKGLTGNNLDVLDKAKSYTFMSNHRDIVLDASLLNLLLIRNGIKTSEIAIGNNLLIYDWISDLVRLNKSFIVKRDVGVRQMLDAARQLSGYIHFAITKKNESVWIAQREGRSKDSDDRTQESLIKMLGISGEGYVSIVECKLETGRTHQIRVHMKHIGHTLFNDERYGGDQILKGTTFTKYKQFVQNCFEICPRQALHAKTLGFKHPVTGEEMFFDSPIPQDMTLLFDKWRNYTANRDI